MISGGGFDSLTAKHDLAQEIAKSNRPVRLLHVGDYDPSGVHLFSALDEDVRGFLTRLNPDARVVSERVAILPEQFERFQLQPAPAKATDNSSFVGIGDDPTAAVQAEALAPDDLADLVEAALRGGWDEDAAAPFLGAVIAITLIHEPITPQLVIAGVLMAFGVWLHLTERHSHEHTHEALENEHSHVHDEHHRHAHEGTVTEPHSHWHRHEPLRRRHAHYPDLHHRHEHG